MNVRAGVPRFLLKPLAPSTGFLSRTFSATRPKDSRSYFLKVGTENPAARKFCRKIHGFQREIAAYQLLEKVRLRVVPRCLANVASPDGSDGLILLEKVSPTTPGNQLNGLSFPKLAAAIHSIGIVHAYFWKKNSLDKTKSLPAHHYNLAHETSRSLSAFLRNTRLGLSSSDIKKATQLPHRVEQALRQTKKRSMTLVHGDLRADNLLFSGKQVVLVDWQMATKGLGAFDLARLIGGSHSRQLPCFEQRKLVHLWQETLRRHGVRNYSREDAWQDYLLGVTLCLSIPVTNAPTLASFSPRGRQMAKLITKRFLNSARELGIW